MMINIIRENGAVCLKVQGSVNEITAPVLKKTTLELMQTNSDIYLDLKDAGQLTEAGTQVIQELQLLAEAQNALVLLEADATA